MSRIALTFAVLDSGGSAAELGLVFAASVFPQVLVMVGAGVLADRLGRRRVMLGTDATRFVVQAALAAALFAGRPSLWLFMLLPGLLSAGEGFFGPALSGLQSDLVPAADLPEANALISVAQSAAAIAGPALSGFLVAVSTPAVVISLDAASYGASLLALCLLRVSPGARPAQSPWRDLTDGWAVFRGQAWLLVITVQFALFNLFTWAPYLLLGPIVARQQFGGAGAWGAITASYAGGAVLAGLGMHGRRPRRPLVIAALATFGYLVPCLLLALGAPVYAVAAGAAVAGLGSIISGTLGFAVKQQRVPRQMLARVSAITLTGSYALGSAGWAVIGPLSQVVGPRPLLAVAAGYASVSSMVVLALPAIRSVTWLPHQASEADHIELTRSSGTAPN
jgi:MFS family permease